VPVDLDQGQFFTEPVALPFVRAEVNRLLGDERVIKAVKFLLDRFRSMLRARYLLFDRRVRCVNSIRVRPRAILVQQPAEAVATPDRQRVRARALFSRRSTVRWHQIQPAVRTMVVVIDRYGQRPLEMPRVE
jgi:hypothetical protein